MDFMKLIQEYGIATIVLAGFAYAVWQIGRAIVRRIVRLINNDGRPEPKPVEHKTDTDRRLRTATVNDRPSLKAHFFFTTANQLVSDEIDKIDCGCQARTLLFQDMCRTMTLRWRDFLLAIVENESSGVHIAVGRKRDTSGYSLGRDVLAAFQRWRTDTEAEWRRSGIPEPAIKAFTEWVRPRLDALRDTTGLISSSQYYEDSVQRIACIMSAHEVALRLIVLDMNNVIYSLNGRLDGHLYKNVAIVPIKTLILAKIEADNARLAADESFKQRTASEMGFSGARDAYRTPLPGSIQVPRDNPIKPDQEPK